jgi:hypothetical protein
MNSISLKPESSNNQSDIPQQPEGCKLGRDLADCPLRRVGCGSLYSAVMYVLPPWSVREYVKATMGNDPAVKLWLTHLDHVAPNVLPSTTGREFWR